MYLICLVTSKDDMIKDSWKFMDGSSSGYITTLTSLLNIGILLVEI